MADKLKLLDLFSGIGGFSLGLERTGGFETVAFCEIEDFPRRVLAQHWPEVPCYEDIRELNAPTLSRDGIEVDAISAGFPCQDISVAGRGEGLDGDRSGLWFEVLRLISELRPRVIFLENVAALLSRGLGVVIGGLAKIGYDCVWHCIRACRFGLPHHRDRIWIVAHPGKERAKGSLAQALQRLPALQGGENVRRAEAWARLPELSKAGLCGSYHGIPNGVDRTGSLGNAVAPIIPECLGNAYLESISWRKAA